MTSTGSNTGLFYVDDTNSILSYQGNWSVSADSPYSFDNTTTTAQSVGAAVTLLFNGSFVSVYGDSASPGSSFQVILDSESQPVSTSTAAPPSTSSSTDASTSTSTSRSSRPLYFSSLLPFDVHNLTITVMTVDSKVDTVIADSSSSSRPARFVLDYFEYTGIAPRDGGPGSHPSHSSSNPQGHSHEHSHHGLSGGAIAGIVIGVLVFVAVLVALVYVYLRRRGRGQGDHIMMDRMNVLEPEPPQDKIVYYISDPVPRAKTKNRFSLDLLRDHMVTQWRRHVGPQAELRPLSPSHPPPLHGPVMHTRSDTSSAMFTSVIMLSPPVSTAAGSGSQGTRTVASAPSTASRGARTVMPAPSAGSSNR